MKCCKGCKLELDDIKFYYLGFLRKSGKKALSSYCRSCESLRVNPSRKKKYKPHSRIAKQDITEQIIVKVDTLYSLIKKIEINSHRIDMIDSFRLVDEYIKIFSDDIPDYYTELEQLDIMFFRLKEYIEVKK